MSSNPIEKSGDFSDNQKKTKKAYFFSHFEKNSQQAKFSQKKTLLDGGLLYLGPQHRGRLTWLKTSLLSHP
jgi:hypothetical protein